MLHSTKDFYKHTVHVPVILVVLHIDSYPKNIHCVSSFQCLLHFGATNNHLPISMPVYVTECHTNELIKKYSPFRLADFPSSSSRCLCRLILTSHLSLTTILFNSPSLCMQPLKKAFASSSRQQRIKLL